jgi:hypothetical protein
MTMKGAQDEKSSWVVEWGMADDVDKVNIVCHNKTHPA